MKRIFASLALLGSLCGCTIPLGNLTVLATEPVTNTAPLSGPSVEGVDCVHFVLFAIPVSGQVSSSMERALRRALERVPDGNALTDVAIYNDLFFGYVYNRLCTRVQGTVAQVQ